MIDVLENYYHLYKFFLQYLSLNFYLIIAVSCLVNIIDVDFFGLALDLFDTFCLKHSQQNLDITKLFSELIHPFLRPFEHPGMCLALDLLENSLIIFVPSLTLPFDLVLQLYYPFFCHRYLLLQKLNSFHLVIVLKTHGDGDLGV